MAKRTTQKAFADQESWGAYQLRNTSLLKMQLSLFVYWKSYTAAIKEICQASTKCTACVKETVTAQGAYYALRW